VVQRIDEVYILHSDHPDEILKDDIWDFTVELMRRWVARREEDPEDDSLDQRFWVTSV
jgi:hypothetical protein